MTGEDASSRVERERAAHEERDVLGESLKLKKLFPHTLASPAMSRMARDYDRELVEAREVRMLEVGSGYGEMSIAMAQNGAQVLGIDISAPYIERSSEARDSAGVAAEQCRFAVMDVHALDLPDASFDWVFGKAILHHLDLKVAMMEIRRVLRPGGRMLFIEPLADNPLLRLFRLMTPSARTVDERPLDRADLRSIADHWIVHSRYYGLLSAPTAVLTSLILRPYPGNWLLRSADRVEQRLNLWEWVHPYNQYVMLCLERPTGSESSPGLGSKA